MSNPPALVAEKPRKKREVQNWGQSFGLRTPDATSPNMCIAASRFLIARLDGLFPESAGHLNEFLNSSHARQLAPEIDIVRHRSLWGSPLHAFDAAEVVLSNSRVVPALLEWGGLKRGATIQIHRIAQLLRARGRRPAVAGSPAGRRRPPS